MDDKQIDKYILQQKLLEVLENSTSVQEMADWCARFSKKFNGKLPDPPPPPPKEEKSYPWRDLAAGSGTTLTNYTISQDSLMGQITISPNTYLSTSFGKKNYMYAIHKHGIMADQVARDYAIMESRNSICEDFKSRMITKDIFTFEHQTEKDHMTLEVRNKTTLQINIDKFLDEVLHA